MPIARRTLLGTGLATAILPGRPLRAQRRGGTLNVIVQPEPPTLMLGVNQQGPVELVGSKIYQSLLTYGFDLKPRPGLARAWEASDDGLRYRFSLQEGVRWHDGTPFSAADVVFSFAKFLPDTNPRARAILANVASVSAPDAATVQVEMKQPFAAFLSGFVPSSLPIVPRHIYEGTDFRTNPANQRPVGTGPFMFKEWQRGQYIQLVRNPSYWKSGLPFIDEIYFRILPDAAARAYALESGEVDVGAPDAVELFEVERLTSLPQLEATGRGSEFASPMTWIEINHRVPPLNDRRFRQALLYAIDRAFIRDRIWFGHGGIPNGPIASTIRFHDPSIRPYPYDPARAEALLDEMGLRRGANGVRTTLSLIPLPYGETWRRLGEFLRQSLARVGIAINLESMDPASWIQRVSNWDYQLTVNRLQQFGDPAFGVARTYISTNIRKGVMFNNTMGYANPRVDELFALGASATTEAARATAYSEVQRILAEDVPVAWLLEIRTPTIFNRRVQDLISTALGVNDSFDSAHLTR